MRMEWSYYLLRKKRSAIAFVVMGKSVPVIVGDGCDDGGRREDGNDGDCMRRDAG